MDLVQRLIYLIYISFNDNVSGSDYSSVKMLDGRE